MRRRRRRRGRHRRRRGSGARSAGRPPSGGGRRSAGGVPDLLVEHRSQNRRAFCSHSPEKGPPSFISSLSFVIVPRIRARQPANPPPARSFRSPLGFPAERPSPLSSWTWPHRAASAQVLADGSFARADARGVANDHGGALPAAGDLDGMRGGAAGGEFDGETDAAAVRGSPTLEAGGCAGGGEPAVDLVDAEADDRIPRFRRDRGVQAADCGRAAAACRLRTAAAQLPTRRRTSARPPVGSVFERRTVTTTSLPSRKSTSAQCRLATSLRRRAPWNSRATIAPSTRPRRSAVFGRSRPRPVRRGRRQVARTVAHSSAVRPRARPRRLGASTASVRRNPSSACRVSVPIGAAVLASRAARLTVATTIAAVAGARPAS